MNIQKHSPIQQMQYEHILIIAIVLRSKFAFFLINTIKLTFLENHFLRQMYFSNYMLTLKNIAMTQHDCFQCL